MVYSPWSVLFITVCRSHSSFIPFPKLWSFVLPLAHPFILGILPFCSLVIVIAPRYTQTPFSLSFVKWISETLNMYQSAIAPQKWVLRILLQLNTYYAVKNIIATTFADSSTHSLHSSPISLTSLPYHNSVSSFISPGCGDIYWHMVFQLCLSLTHPLVHFLNLLYCVTNQHKNDCCVNPEITLLEAVQFIVNYNCILSPQTIWNLDFICHAFVLFSHFLNAIQRIGKQVSCPWERVKLTMH